MSSELSISKMGELESPYQILQSAECNCSLHFSANCFKNRLMASMLEHVFLSGNVDLEQARECPMLRCQRPFSDARSMLLHLKHCDKIPQGEIWCQSCRQSRKVKRSFSQKVGHCMNHIIGKRSSPTKYSMAEGHPAVTSVRSSRSTSLSESPQEIMGNQPICSADGFYWPTIDTVEMPGDIPSWEMGTGLEGNSANPPSVVFQSQAVNQMASSGHTIVAGRGLVGASQYDSGVLDANPVYTQRKESPRDLPRIQTNTHSIQQYSPMADSALFTDPPSSNSNRSYAYLQPSPQSFQQPRNGPIVSRASFSSGSSFSHQKSPGSYQSIYHSKNPGTSYAAKTSQAVHSVATQPPPPAYDMGTTPFNPLTTWQAAENFQRPHASIENDCTMISSPETLDDCEELHESLESLSDEQTERRFGINDSEKRIIDTNQLKCPHCGFVPRKKEGSTLLKRKNNLQRHVRRMHKMAKSTLECKCGAMCSRKDNMQRHQRLKECPID